MDSQPRTLMPIILIVNCCKPHYQHLSAWLCLQSLQETSTVILSTCPLHLTCTSEDIRICNHYIERFKVLRCHIHVDRLQHLTMHWLVHLEPLFDTHWSLWFLSWASTMRRHFDLKWTCLVAGFLLALMIPPGSEHLPMLKLCMGPPKTLVNGVWW